jgi:drug/metabolite transporter (DMT)-like permease
MNYRDLIGLLTLGMLWGVSFLFIRVAVPEFGAVALMAVRVTLAAAVLLPLLLYRGQLQSVLEHWRAISLMGVLHYAVPFTLFAYSMQTLSAGYSSVINASAPLFAASVAWIWMGERLNASRTAGLAIGMLGVVLLVWDKLAVGSSPVALAVLASVLAAFCYGLAAVLAKKKLAGVEPIAVAAGSMVAAALVLLPLSFFLWPATTPSIHAWGMAAALGVLCTAAAFVLYFRLIATIGPSRAITVTYLIPVFAVVFGAMFIDERITASMIAGGLVVALGTSLSTGLIDLQVFTRKTAVVSTRMLGLLLVFAAAIHAPEDAHADEWQVSTPVYFAANSFAVSSDDGRRTFVTLAATAELEMIKVGSPWAVNLFAEFHLSPEKRVDGTLFAGVQGSYFWRSMDLAGFWFTSQYPGSASEQTFMTRLRHQFAPGHKIGVEYLARTDAPRAGELKLGYYGSIHESVSLKFLFGAVPSDGWEPLARLELRWRLT